MRRIILTSLCLLFSVFPLFAQDEITHTLQVGDTLQSLAEQYDTCREAIIYDNDLSLAGKYSAYYMLSAGTILIMPSRSKCDFLPTGFGGHIVQEGETVRELYIKYRFPIIYYLTGDDNAPWVSLSYDNRIEPGMELIIAPIEPFYSTTQELWVIDEATQFETANHTLQVGDTLADLTETYQTCREAIIWENQLMLERVSSVVYVLHEVDILIIPPATACDELPFGEYTITLDERMTQQTIIQKYQQYESTYFHFNDPQEGLLAVGDEQIIPNIDFMFAGDFEIHIIGLASEFFPSTHIAQKGDTFPSLAHRYQTCVDVILYANQLERTSAIDPTFKVKVGTELRIPSASDCDNIPNDPIVHTVVEGESLWSIAYRYNTRIRTMIIASDKSPESQIGTGVGHYLLRNEDTIGPGLKLVIPDGSWQYILKPWDRLLVHDDDDFMFEVSKNLSISEIAKCHGVNTWDIYEVNGLPQSEHGYKGSVIVPNPKHDCILRDYGYWLGTIACYSAPFEQLVDAEVTIQKSPVSPADGTHCYSIRDVYEELFKNQSVILYDRVWSYDASPNHQWGLTMDRINFCFRHDKDLLQDITWDTYDASILPPDDNIRVFALPKHITCNREMFDDYYVYRVRSFDTLSNIAKAYGTHPDLIAQANNIDNPHLVYRGQYLQIPTPTIFHVMQGVGGVLVLLIGGWGLRRVLRRNRHKVKRKPKEA